MRNFTGNSVCLTCGEEIPVGHVHACAPIEPFYDAVPKPYLQQMWEESERKHIAAKSASTPSDPVDHPQHYARWAMEPIEFIAINNLPWWLANVVKYTMRFDAKDGLKDLYKARSYLDMKIRQQENQKRFWEKPVAEERRLNAS